MNLIVNGENREVLSTSLQELVAELKLADQLVVAEVNGVIVDRSNWEATVLSDGMQIELVHFVGGG